MKFLELTCCLPESCGSLVNQTTPSTALDVLHAGDAVHPVLQKGVGSG